MWVEREVQGGSQLTACEAKRRDDEADQGGREDCVQDRRKYNGESEHAFQAAY